MDVYEECKLAFDSFVYSLFYAVYIDMGLSSNSPVVLTVVTSGQSFARSFSVKVGISVFGFGFGFALVFPRSMSVKVRNMFEQGQA